MSIVSLEDLLALREGWRARGLRVVCTNGVFDLLHSGHVAYLAAARALGDLLVVGLNSDESTRAIKGPRRPLVPAAERAEVLAALRSVDYVTIFGERTAEALVAALQPEIYVKGGDYAAPSATLTAGAGEAAPVFDEARLPEARVVRGYGGQVALLPYRPGRSTSALIQRIIERFAQREGSGEGTALR